MEESIEVRDAVLAFYRGITNKEIERFDEIVSAHPATLVIGTAPGEWVTERPRLRFGFEAEGLAVEPGRAPTGYVEGSLGWFVDEPRFVLPNGTGFRTRLTAVLRHEDGRWKVVHMHWSTGVPDDEIVELQQRWDIT
jgi:hypothetical protein